MKDEKDESGEENAGRGNSQVQTARAEKEPAGDPGKRTSASVLPSVKWEQGHLPAAEAVVILSRL